MTAVGGLALAQEQKNSGEPAPRAWSGDQLVRYPDPDVVAVDNRFRKYMVGNTVIQRLFTGTLWPRAWPGTEWAAIWCGAIFRTIARYGGLKRTPRYGFSLALRLQQRQHVRLRRPPAFLRAWQSPRGAL